MPQVQIFNVNFYTYNLTWNMVSYTNCDDVVHTKVELLGSAI